MVSKLRARDASFRNEILCALSDNELDLLRPHLKQVALKSGQVLHEPNSPIKDVFFVEKGVVSLTADTHDHGQVEVGLTGREGLVGASAILNPRSYSVHRAFIQAEGDAYRLSTTVLRSAVERSATLRDRCLRYLEMLMVQTSQAAACNARHNLPERLARWLLMVRDRIDSDDLPMTQEFLSVMLGVRRSGVSVAASTLQAGGLIQLSRGHVTITDHDGLAAAACDCYRLIEQSRGRILGRPSDGRSSNIARVAAGPRRKR
jgi:CRP-like cAMP-binding protein